MLWTISLRAARPAIVAGAVLALARALGEAIMLAMVSGGVIFAPNPVDGLTFAFEPVLPLAAAIVQGAEGISVKPYGATLFAMAAVIMVSSVGLSITGWAVRRRLRRFGVRGMSVARPHRPAGSSRAWPLADRDAARAVLGRRACC